MASGFSGLVSDLIGRFIPPGVDESDLESMHRARLLIGVSFFGLPLAAFFGLFFIIVLDARVAGTAVLAGGVVLAGLPWLLRTTGSIALCGHLVAGLVVALISLIAWIRGGYPVSALIFLLPLVLSRFILGARAAMAWTLAGGAVMIAFFCLALFGLTNAPPDAFTPRLTLWLDGIGLVGVLVLLMFVTMTHEFSRQRSETRRRRIAAQLEQSERLESVGQLAGSVAHDFNNLLTVIRGSAEMALEEAGDVAGLRQDLQEIRAAADRAADLTGRLLLFSRRELVRPEPLNLAEVLPELRSLLRRSLREDLKLSISAPDDLKPILADRRQMEQLLVNLAVNARDAMPAGGAFSIQASQATVLGESEPGKPPPGRYVQLEIADTGQGMDPEVVAQVFEPFFTTKERGLGTGLGLSTVHGIVTRFDGHIRVASTPGEGTRFTILFPVLADPQAVTAESGEYGDPIRGRGQQILLVEDEAQVRKTVSRLLTGSGYRVIEAVDGRQARELLDCDSPEVDLLVTDVVMPGMSGAELAAWVGQRHPGIRILFVSGYTDGELSAQGLEPEQVRLLRKPFSSDQLRGAVHLALSDERID